MSFENFSKFAEGEASRVLDDLSPGMLSQDALPDLDKGAMEEAGTLLEGNKVGQDTPGNISASLATDTNGMSPLAENMVNKIASELTELTLQTGLQEVSDPDYKYLLKEAGINPPSTPDPKFHELVVQSNVKIASNGDFVPIDQEKVAATTKAQQKLLKKVWKEMPGIARWGTTGRYAAAAVPVAGIAAYLKGRSSGKEKGKQELADALMKRYKANRGR